MNPQPDERAGVDIVVIPRVELFDAAYANLEEDYPKRVIARASLV